MASMLKRGLEEEGYSIDLASDGNDGLWMGSENPYDAIVLDVNLPGINGFEVCRGLRQRERWAPVIMLTARGDPQDRIHGLDAGADDYLMKPFSFGELTARLRALIRRGAPPRPVILTVGDLHVDPVARRAAPRHRRTRLESQGVRSSRAVRPPSRGAAHPHSHSRARLGFRLRRCVERRGPVRRVSAPQDRQAIRTKRPRDRPRGRLSPARPDGGMTGCRYAFDSP